jgi:hypothetical protein
MKRREAKFVHASPRMSPDQIAATPRLREDRPRATGKGMRDKTTRAVVAVERPQNRKRS